MSMRHAPCVPAFPDASVAQYETEELNLAPRMSSTTILCLLVSSRICWFSFLYAVCPIHCVVVSESLLADERLLQDAFLLF